MGMLAAAWLIYSHTGLRKFIDVCGVAGTAELFYVGRNVDTERAERMGLVNLVIEPKISTPARWSSRARSPGTHRSRSRATSE